MPGKLNPKEKSLRKEIQSLGHRVLFICLLLLLRQCDNSLQHQKQHCGQSDSQILSENSFDSNLDSTSSKYLFTDFFQKIFLPRIWMLRFLKILSTLSVIFPFQPPTIAVTGQWSYCFCERTIQFGPFQFCTGGHLDNFSKLRAFFSLAF